MLEHHHARQNHAARIHLILIRVLRRGAMRGFEDGMAGHVIDIAARRDSDAADLRRERIAQVIAVQIWRRDDVEIFGSGQHLLKGDVLQSRP